MTNPRTASVAYTEHVNSIESQLKTLTEWVKGLTVYPEVCDWSMVGDLAEVDMKLKQALDFLRSIPQ